MNKKRLILGFLIAGSIISIIVLTGCGNKEVVKNLDYEVPEYDAKDVESEESVDEQREGAKKNFGIKNEEENQVQRKSSNEMIKACQDSSEGVVCSFNIVNHDGEEQEVVGECKISSMDENQLVCASKDGQRGSGGKNRKYSDLE